MTTSSEPLLSSKPPTEIRGDLLEIVRRDLLGPAGGPEEEVAENQIRERYLLGILAPRGAAPRAAEEEDRLEASDDAAEDGEPDEESGQDSLFPSAIGLTFCVDSATTTLTATASWGRYTRTEAEIDDEEGKSRRVWRREPMSFAWELAMTPGTHRASSTGDEGIDLEALVRDADGSWVVTLFMRNVQPEPLVNKAQAWVFQPELRVDASDARGAFIRKPQPPPPDDEARRLEMLYRDRVEFATGHGVAVHAEVSDEDPRRAIWLATRVVPAYEVRPTIAPTAAEQPALAGLELDMQVLADAEAGALRAMLQPLVDGYRAWIDEQAGRIGDPAARLEGFGETAEEALRFCRTALGRIDEGIRVIEDDPVARRAFQFANRAMALQRIHSIHAQQARRGARTPAQPVDDLDIPENRSWRPFQLAFVLLNLASLTDVGHPHRADPTDAVCDLLWFPTGGGKTEAYLGLAAYAMALRRLQGEVAGHDGGVGVAVLMRYTLRVLTLQQFQRAAALICACELLRRQEQVGGDDALGTEPFRIGLWVGRRTTPNTVKDAQEAQRTAKGDYFSPGGSGTPAQLTNCPWCGTDIEPGRDIQVDPYENGHARVLTYCGDALGRCEFTGKRSPGEGLPAVVVDEEIYRRVPSLLIATVDKFAQLPWNGVTEALFGRVTGRCERHGYRTPDLLDTDSHPTGKNGLPPAKTVDVGVRLRPPDLIIQDELHLIAGPLGTMVGLYETVIDELCTWEVDGTRVRPKVVASTATVRRASEQVQALFLRRVEVFPPPGLDASDSFFAREVDPTPERPGRLYVGICAPGRRLKAALIRTYVALLAGAQQLFEQQGARTDPWMTLVGYFNAMQELAGMRRLVEDDIRTRLMKSDQRGLTRRSLRTGYQGGLEELTSRANAADIPKILDRLEERFDPTKERQRALDVLLATSMISVGVDVQRLGLMVVGGQPKTTSEYIQATSRVGRSAEGPGLVATVLNWARPRDLSHYERFEHYHATFYKQVEPLSVTPFAARAVDRGLSALLVALARLTDEELNANAAARDVSRSRASIREAVERIAFRATQVTQSPEVGEQVRAALESRIDLWLARAKPDGKGTLLAYQRRKDGTTIGLLSSPTIGEWEDFTCLNSLRDVEPSVGLILDPRVAVAEEG
jgi:hypothetical protein